jgi:hypothetical protein
LFFWNALRLLPFVLLEKQRAVEVKERSWNNTNMGKTDVLGEIPVPVPFCPLLIELVPLQ